MGASQISGGGSTVFYGEAPPEVQTLTFLETIFYGKSTPFVYLP